MEPEISNMELWTVKKASKELGDNVSSILERNDRIEIAAMRTDGYVKDLHSLLERTAEITTPLLKKLGLEREAVVPDVEGFVKMLEDNEHQPYFASINVDVKYKRNKSTLILLQDWFKHLEKAIDRITEYLETEFEEKELDKVFKLIDSTNIADSRKKEIKKEIVRAVNRLNRNAND
jgi:hypothetical protein